MTLATLLSIDLGAWVFLAFLIFLAMIGIGGGELIRRRDTISARKVRKAMREHERNG